LQLWTQVATGRIVGHPEVGRGVSIKAIRIRLGHESLDVTLAFLKGKDAESEEAQEHANSSSLALYA
jgi:hypothetical protein